MRKKLEERLHENFTEREDADRHQDEERKGVVQDDACLDVLLLTEADGEKSVAAHADHHGHCHDKKTDREAQRDARNAEASDSLPNEETVHYVVEGVDQHADDSGDREL